MDVIRYGFFRGGAGYGLSRRGITLILLALAAAASGCAGSRGGVVREVTVPFTPEHHELLAKSETEPYLLQRGDVFAVRSFSVPEIEQDGVMVRPDGRAGFVGLDDVLVVGKSTTAVDSLLTEFYGRTYRDVDLSITLQDVAGRSIYVLGEVERPGLYEMGGGIGLLGAIAQAGGFTDWASKGSVVLLRVDADGYLCRELDMSALHEGKGLDPALLDVRPYDIVYVTRSAIGDFAAFTRNLIVPLSSYTRMILDLRTIEDPDTYYRR